MNSELRKYRRQALVMLLIFVTVWYNTVGFGINFAPKAKAASFTCAVSGVWDDGATWGNTSPGVEGTDYPGVNDSAIVDSANAVTITGDVSFADLTISGVGSIVRVSGSDGEMGDVGVESGGDLRMEDNLQHTFGDIVVENGSYISQQDSNTTAQNYTININATSIDIQAGAIVNGDSMGYAGGALWQSGKGYGAGSYGGDNGGNGAGAGHGGNGADGLGNEGGGDGYCDITNPATMGSGGGGGSVVGGDGGGLIILTASNTITVNGTITADGGVGGDSGTYNDSGGGAGGGIKISANTIAGTPESFTAVGGLSNDGSSGGGGGGGCVLLNYTTSNSITSADVDVYGGTGVHYGGAGQLYITKTSGDKDLFVINNGNKNEETAPTLQILSSMTVDSITVASSSQYVVASSRTLVLNDTDPFAGGNASGTIVIAGGTLTPTTNFTIRNTVLDFVNSSFLTSSSSINLIIENNGALNLVGFSTTTSMLLNSLTVKSGGILSHNSNESTTQDNVINITAGTIDIQSGGLVDADEYGYAGGEDASDGKGPGKGVYNTEWDGSGAGHCGDGGNDTNGDPGGQDYCNINSPGTIGSGGGGGGDAIGGYGGGFVGLTSTGDLTIAGTITADGGNGVDGGFHGRDAGGGAGGGIKLEGQTVVFSGSITATGGNGGSRNNSGGGGGGGCILISYLTYNNTGSSYSVAGGTGANAGGAGSFLTDSLNESPISTAISPIPERDASGFVTVTTTITDEEDDTVTLYVDYSDDDGLTWASTTLYTVTGDGTPATSTGKITNITSTADGNALTFIWNSRADGLDYCAACQIRLVPNDGTSNGTTVNSASFEMDNANPANFGNLTISSTSTTSVVFKFGAPTDDPTFFEYKIFYKLGSSGVTESDTAFTSSTDADLGFINYNGTETTEITGLSINKQYVANLWVYDEFGNQDNASEITFYTLANAPGVPTVGSATANSLAITIAENSNPSNTTYAIYNNTEENYIGADGAASAVAVYQTTSTWNNIIATGLSPNVSYQFATVARNGNNILTATSTASIAKYTLANVAGIPTIGIVTEATILITVNTNFNIAATTYAIYNNTSGNYIAANGSSSATAVYQTNTAWGSISATGLSADTAYQFSVVARNGDSIDSATSTASTAKYTLANAPGIPTAGIPTATTIPITINTNSNPANTTYAIYNSSLGNYIAADGSASVSAIYQTNVAWGSISATGLSPNVAYQFTTKAKNGDNVETSISSASAAKYTLANAAGTPTVGTPTVSTLPITIDVNSNPAATTYAIYNNTTGNYIAANGSSSATAVYQTNVTWGSVSATGLSVDTAYQFSIVARNGDSVDSATSTASTAKYTLANAPGTPTVGTATVTTIPITIAENSNPSNTTYAIYNTTTANYISATGASSATAVYQTNTAWGSISATGLSTNTSYQFVTVARNGDNVVTATSTASTAKYTLANAAGVPTAGSATASSLAITIDENSNNAATTYAIYNTTTANYISATGASSATAVYQTTSTWNSIVVTGLSGNNAYQFAVVSRNGDSVNSATSTVSTAKYTLASTPSSVTATGGNVLDITVSWSGNASSYYIENSTAGTNSGWISGTSHTFTGLSCGTNYSFTVKGKNAEGVETSVSSSANATSSGCGGGMPISMSVTPPSTQPTQPEPQAEPEPQVEPEPEVKEPEPEEKVEEKVEEKKEEIKKEEVKQEQEKTEQTEQKTETSSSIALEEAEARVIVEKQGIPVEVTNTKNVDIVLDAKYSKVTLQDDSGHIIEKTNIQPLMPWDFGGEDGEKCITATFYDSNDNPVKRKTTCVTVDTVAPEMPKIKIDTKVVVEQEISGKKVTLQGETEPLSTLYISRERIGGGVGFISNIPLANLFVPEVANAQELFSTTADAKGRWSFTFPDLFNIGEYTVTVYAEDKAGNISGTSVIIVNVSEDELMMVVMKAVDAVKQVINNPKVEKINETYAAPAVVAIGVANAAAGFQLPQILVFLKYLFTQPILLLRRKKYKRWGTVYNAYTKEPVDLATVRLIDASTSKIMHSQVTDIWGRYFMSGVPGELKLEVDKQGYSGLSKILEGKNEDIKYANLYHGELLKIEDENTQINYSIPLEPDQHVKETSKLIKEKIVQTAQQIIALSGLIMTGGSLIISPKPSIFGFLLVHILIYFMSRRFSRVEKLDSSGTVTEKGTGRPIKMAVVRIFDVAYNKLVNTKLTDNKGRYAVLVGPSKYYVTYEKPGYEQKKSSVLDYSEEKTNGLGGLIIRDEELEVSKNPFVKEPVKIETPKEKVIEQEQAPIDMAINKEKQYVQEVQKPVIQTQAPVKNTEIQNEVQDPLYDDVIKNWKETH